MRKTVLSISLLITLTNCNMFGYSGYEELHEHNGNKGYEIATVLNEEYLIREILIDNEKKQLIVSTKTTPIKEEDTEYRRLKVSILGNIIDEGPIYTLLKDGTLWYTNHYNNWIVDNDTTKQQYLHPFSDKNYNPEEWLLEFKKIYDRASISYYYNGRYFIKIDDQWNEIDKNFEIENFDFDKHFPDKYANIRMIDLKDHTPDFSREAFQRDTSLWTYHGYEEADREEGVGLNPINFSAGWHYLQLKMPGSEPLKIKRYGSMGANLHTYIIPEEYGGREDVIFIMQEPSSLYPDREHGGMYVVRPRELEENTVASQP